MFVPIYNSDGTETGYTVNEKCVIKDKDGNEVRASYSKEGRPRVSIRMDGKERLI